MPVLNIHLDGEGAFRGLDDPEQIIHVTDPIDVAVLPNGMESGRPSVAFRIPLPDGRTVLAETSLRLVQILAMTAAARYPDDGAD